MAQLNLEEAKDRLLKLLVFFDEVCRKHNIDYWIDGGTLLGAVRHDGFIPWDDDIDVCILDEDFDKMLVALKSELKTKKDYILYNSHRPYPVFSDFLGDSRVITSGNVPLRIDLLRVKSMKNDSDLIKKDREVQNLLSYFMETYHEESEIRGELKEKFYDNRGYERRRKFMTWFLKDYVPNLPKDDTEKLIYNYNFGDMFVKKERVWYNHEQIFPLSSIKFEGHEFKAPCNISSYLTVLYGENYMTPPDKKYQVVHSDKFSLTKWPVWFVKRWIYVIYLLKEVANYRRLKKRIK